MTAFEDAIEQIKNNLDIYDTISKYVVLKRRGQNYIGLCPFHNEKTPSFTVMPSKQIFKCFGCNEGGDVLTFLMKINNQSFMDLIKEQAEIFGIELPRTYNPEATKEKKKEKDIIYSALDMAMKFYHKELLDNDKALEYLKNRGVSDVAIQKFALGLAPKGSKTHLKDFLKSKNSEDFTNDILIKAGLLLELSGDYIDRFKNRIIIPILDTQGRAIALGGRAILPDQQPKYINSPETPIYNKSSVLFGLYSAQEAIKKEDSAIIMEGYFDVISAQVHGVSNAVASCGTALTAQHIKLLSRFTPSRKIYLAFDTDSAGLKATNAGAEVIRNIFKNLGNIKQYDSSYCDISDSVCEIRVVSQIAGKDPDEFIREFGAEEYLKNVKNAPLLLDFQLNQIFKDFNSNMNSQEKIKIIQQIADILSEIENPVVLSDYIRRYSYQLNIEEHILKNQVVITKNREKYSNVTKYEDENLGKKIKKNDLETQIFNCENNLLKLALTIDTPEKKVYFLQSIKDFKFENEYNERIFKELDSMLSLENNHDKLAKNLFTSFCNDVEAKSHLTDLIYSSSEFENLNYDDFTQAISEIFDRISAINNKIKKNKLRQKYKSDNITEDEKKALTKEIYSQFGYRRKL